MDMAADRDLYNSVEDQLPQYGFSHTQRIGSIATNSGSKLPLGLKLSKETAD
jgi:hypothetical protein